MGERHLQAHRAFDMLGVDPLNRCGPPRSARSRGATRGRRPNSGSRTGRRQAPAGTPAPAPASPPAAAPEQSLFWKTIYLGHAYQTSYVMQGKSATESAWNWGRGLFDDDYKPGRVQSYLGGAFLRMYLDHEIDPEVIDQAGKEVADSKEWKALTEAVTAHLQQIANRTPKPLDEEAVQKHAHRFLEGRLKRGGIQFRDTLNPVIGGAGGIEVMSAKHVSDGARSGRKVASTYELSVKIRDVYDFQNKRSGEYQRYRENLATLLRSNQYDRFNYEYLGEAQPFTAFKRTNLDLAGTFASFMYALERKGWTPGGLAWEVTVPMLIEFREARNQ